MVDVTIVGAGVAGTFLAHTLIENHPGLQVKMVDLGKPLKERHCAREYGQPCTCSGECDQYIGFGGLGKSEGKFNFTHDFGGELSRKIGEKETDRLMEKVDHILVEHGGGRVQTYSTDNDQVKERAAAGDLKVLTTEVRHLGSSLAREVFQSLYEHMENQLSFSFNTRVQSITPSDYGFRVLTDGEEFYSRKIVLATGNSGREWFSSITESMNIKPKDTRLDLGVRVEMRGGQLDALLKETFETKLLKKTNRYTAYTYCMNPKGRIIRKHQHGLVMPDGQNSREQGVPGENVNFTLFVPRYFPDQWKAMEEAERIIGGINRSGDRIVVQRLEDFKSGRDTTSLHTNRISPSLDAEKGSLREEVPSVYMDALTEFLTSLEKALGEPVDPDTLLYGLDAKFYEPVIPTNETFETNVPGLFLAGDCSSVTHSLSQAAASGIYVGEIIEGKG
ncbi:NAD(FAD)-utilizing dehydrogenase [Halobacillus litoralis]|uniref:NAD(FAD)-utilizing dehydrogenase n=1 Tax=Halobacillus litoralis TaxID=45668 RepID=A0A845DPU0_9BACI|nr:NAD(FAD)-utilizing dehydrogenase [Halobacillus litoralis]MYL19520.1 NAD(FAD)-utilizing dehydrogenase [Halobacillus litoralis]